MKKIAILGSTGSVGINTLKVIAKHPDKFKVTALSCNSNAELLAKQANRFKTRLLAINDLSKIKTLKDGLSSSLGKVRILGGPQGLEELAKISDAHIAVMAVSGSTSLVPLIR
ncbi:MAG: 1-deoxy-D-xylulose-5-phosphate reductoisomerase, partial [Candidatus Omnitrophota bacterium]